MQHMIAYAQGGSVSFWFLLQFLINLVLLSGVVGLWIRLQRPPKDDPRLSKGLQLLQSKIAVLEDLSDRTETQVGQLTALLEQKVKDIQSKIQSADKQLNKIDQSMQKSLEVAKIFQDRIPHGEIVERQNTIKYIKAARLAHQGLSVDEIAAQITDLSRGEIEFIAKVNKDQLMFCEDSLPEWANDRSESTGSALSSDVADLSDVDNMTFMTPLQREAPQDMSTAFEIPHTDQAALKKLGDAFKAACEDASAQAQTQVQNQTQTKAEQNVSALFEVTQNIAQTFLSDKPTPVDIRKDGIVRPVQFRRLDMVKDLR